MHHVTYNMEMELCTLDWAYPTGVITTGIVVKEELEGGAEADTTIISALPLLHSPGKSKEFSSIICAAVIANAGATSAHLRTPNAKFLTCETGTRWYYGRKGSMEPEV